MLRTFQMPLVYAILHTRSLTVGLLPYCPIHYILSRPKFLTNDSQGGQPTSQSREFFIRDTYILAIKTLASDKKISCVLCIHY